MVWIWRVWRTCCSRASTSNGTGAGTGTYSYYHISGTEADTACKFSTSQRSLRRPVRTGATQFKAENGYMLAVRKSSLFALPAGVRHLREHNAVARALSSRCFQLRPVASLFNTIRAAYAVEFLFVDHSSSDQRGLGGSGSGARRKAQSR